MTQTIKKTKMTSILRKDIFQNPITIFFKCLWPHFEVSQWEDSKIVPLQPSGEELSECELKVVYLFSVSLLNSLS